MSYDLQQSIDTMMFLKKIIGKNTNVVIDSGIFKHQRYNELLDVSKDIIEIFGNEDKEIDLDDVVDAYNEMQSQFDEISEKNMDDRSYEYERIKYNKVTKKYEIIWNGGF